MQTGVSTATSHARGAAPCRDERRGKPARVDPPPSSCQPAAGQRQDEVALLLEEAQEQLRALALAHRKQEEGGVGGGASTAALVAVEARETVCFLNLNGGSGGALGCSGPTQTQLLGPGQSHRDLGQTGQ